MEKTNEALQNLEKDFNKKLSIPAQKEKRVVLPTDVWENMEENSKLFLAAKVVSDNHHQQHPGLFLEAIRNAWSSIQISSIKHTGNLIFIIKFSSQEDLERVFKRAPWIIRKHLLVLKKLDHHTVTNKIQFDNALVWVQIHDLPQALITKQACVLFADSVGFSIADTYAEVTQQGRCYARIKVWFDMHKPLTLHSATTNPKNGEELKISFQYEKTGIVCFKCARLGHSQSECEFKEAEAVPTGALSYIVAEVFKPWKLNNSSNTSLAPKALRVETTVELPLPTTSSPLTITRNLLPQLEAVANSKGKKVYRISTGAHKISQVQPKHGSSPTVNASKSVPSTSGTVSLGSVLSTNKAANLGTSSPMIDDSDYDPSEISPTTFSNSTAGADSVSFAGPNAAKLVNPGSATWKQVDPNPNPLQSIFNSESPTPFANPVATLSSLLQEPKKLSSTFVFSSTSLERPKLPTLRHKQQPRESLTTFVFSPESTWNVSLTLPISSPLKNLEAVGAIGEETVSSEYGNGGMGNTESKHDNAHIHFSDADIGGKRSLLEDTTGLQLEIQKRQRLRLSSEE